MKILAPLLVLVFSLSCANTFGGKKLSLSKSVCCNCKKKSGFFSFYLPFYGCKLQKKLICRKCFRTFNRLNDSHVLTLNEQNSEILSKIRFCVFCDNRMSDVKELFNSRLSNRVKSLIYKVAKYHDEKNNTHVTLELHHANPQYFDMLERISLQDDIVVEYPSNIQYFGGENSGTCEICFENKILNSKQVCPNKHGSFICEDCFSRLIGGKCPKCREQFNFVKPLSDEFKFNLK